MRHALVTGASGYIGRHLVAVLLREGVAVRATARDGASAEALAKTGVETVRWSLTDQEIPQRLLKGIDTVFHLAAPRRVYDKAAGTTSRVGGGGLKEGSIRLAEAVAASDVSRMVLTSSVSVYGKPWGKIDETSPTVPMTDYGRGRLEAERACREIFRSFPQRFSIARLGETFGPGSPGQLDLLTRIVEGRFRMIGDGRVLHHLSTVDDTVAGLVALARSESAGGAVLHIGSRARSLRDFVWAAAEAVRQPLKDTPWVGPPARAVLIALRSAPVLRQRTPALHAILDYQLRPRAFSIDRSIQLLGNYATSDFEERVAESARAIGAAS